MANVEIIKFQNEIIQSIKEEMTVGDQSKNCNFHKVFLHFSTLHNIEILKKIYPIIIAFFRKKQLVHYGDMFPKTNDFKVSAIYV